MHFFLTLLFCLLPFTAIAMDVSDCEQIGYMPGNATENNCIMYDDCIAEHHDNPTACTNAVKTDKECAEKIAKENAAASKHDILIKCPATSARREHKSASKDHNSGGNFVMMNGDVVNIDDLINDTEYVYYARISNSVVSFLAGKDAWHVIGPRDGDFFLAIVQE